MTNTEPLFGKPPDNANGKIIGTAINGETSTALPREPHIKIARPRIWCSKRAPRTISKVSSGSEACKCNDVSWLWLAP